MEFIATKKITLLFSIILMLSLVNAATDFGYNNLEKPTLSRVVVNYTTVATNSSDFWDNLDTPLGITDLLNINFSGNTGGIVGTLRSDDSIARFDELGRFCFGGSGSGATKGCSSYMMSEADENWQVNEYGSSLNFYTTAVNGQVPVKAFKLTSNQDFSIPNDGKRVYMGGGDDSYFGYDGTDLVFDGDTWGAGSGDIVMNDRFRCEGKATFNAQANFTLPPPDANQQSATLLINPASSAGNGRLIAGSVGGDDKFWIDEDGDARLVKSLRIQEIGGSNFLDFTLGGFTFESSNPVITLRDTTTGADDWTFKNRNGNMTWETPEATTQRFIVDAKGNGYFPTGNLTSTNFYGEMYIFNESNSVTPISEANSYHNVTQNVSAGLNNGFVFQNGGELLVKVAGVYDVSWNMGFKQNGGAGDEWHGDIGVNYVASEKCHMPRKIGTVTDIGSAGNSCHLQLEVDDIVNFIIENENDADDAIIYNLNINLERIGV